MQRIVTYQTARQSRLFADLQHVFHSQASWRITSSNQGPRTWPIHLSNQLRRACSSSNGSSCGQNAGSNKNIPGPTPKTCRSKTPTVPSALTLSFRSVRHFWKRASINTSRCLVGCTLGDFSALFFLQACYPELGVTTTMGISMAAGITTSLLLETILLRLGKDQLTWSNAIKTAAGMSMVSMLAMESAENLVDYHLTGGIVTIDDPQFWMAAILSMAAGFLTPLPYNYSRLRKYGRSCH